MALVCQKTCGLLSVSGFIYEGIDISQNVNFQNVFLLDLYYIFENIFSKSKDRYFVICPPLAIQTAMCGYYTSL